MPVHRQKKCITPNVTNTFLLPHALAITSLTALQEIRGTNRFLTDSKLVELLRLARNSALEYTCTLYKVGEGKLVIKTRLRETS